MDLPFETVLDGKAMDDFWQAVKWVLFYVAPVVMIWVALKLVGWVVAVIKDMIDEARGVKRGSRYDDDDEYYYD